MVVMMTRHILLFIQPNFQKVKETGVQTTLDCMSLLSDISLHVALNRPLELKQLWKLT
ncbi:DNA topoisomerase 3-alpha [Zea mays]|uniref:DNA topoisomerase 3-alpha n=1 Tax=Zea mays TaxID=4577 RepID=A0A1D6JPR1_MAIZE|nr:DNA topoisomerase 3-alpha [Zea mays]ONL93986.1 DNA topoisomerase 3-alpha [Zea mays]